MVETLVSSYQNGAPLHGFAFTLVQAATDQKSVTPLAFCLFSSIIINERIATCIDFY
jgi:hypothetical protein